MGIYSIGAKLIRNVAKGTVVTEKVGNKVFTNVYDLFGNLQKSRVKQITRMQVGDKKVISIAKVKNADKKHILDKVYDSKGKFLGERSMLFTKKRGQQNLIISKKVGNMFQQKEIIDGRAVSRYIENAAGDNGFRIYHNKKGLPIPDNGLYLDSEYSLREMRIDHFMDNGMNVPYVKEGLGLDALNRVDDLVVRPNFKAGEKLNNLDQYL